MRVKGKLPTDLVELSRRFIQWRRTHAFGTRIPEPLWNAAVELAARHGISQTSRVLNLGYYALKKRIASRARRGQSRPTFVELPPAPAIGSGCVIEFEKPGGLRMRVELKGTPDLVALGRSFWESP
jgi:hypothetical protein